MLLHGRADGQLSRVIAVVVRDVDVSRYTLCVRETLPHDAEPNVEQQDGLTIDAQYKCRAAMTLVDHRLARTYPEADQIYKHHFDY